MEGQGSSPSSSNQEEGNSIKPIFNLQPMSSSLKNVTLKELLSRSSDYIMTIDNRVKDVILLLGNTGAGKTTLSQTLAGDLASLRAEKTKGGHIYIVDQGKKIGGPSTTSVTLMPELVLKKQNDLGEEGEENGGMGTAFFDCSGFADTRDPEYDIAGNFFINQIFGVVSQVKLLFVVNESAISLGSRVDFPRLVGHATEFLKEMEKYEGAIGLVVTKVQSYFNNDFRSDEDILCGIIEFLETYVKDKRSELELSSSELNPNKEADIGKEIQLVKILLEQDGEGNYHRISFSRVPEKLGPLNESKVVASTKKNVSQLYRGLKYVPVDPADFGYSVSSKTKKTLIEYAKKVLSQEVAQRVSALMAEFKEWYNGRYLTTTDINTMTNELQRSTEAMAGLIQSLGASGASRNLKDFLDVVKLTLESFGYIIPLELEQFIQQQQKYFEFFDEANGAQVPRLVNDWISPIKGVNEGLVDLQNWYEFCNEWKGKVGTYEFHRNRQALPHEDGVMQWLDLTGRVSGVPVREDIMALVPKLGRNHLEVIVGILRPALRPVEVIHGDGGRIIITGNYVKMTDINPRIGGFQRIEVYAANTLFIDANLNGEGRELQVVMIAPTWDVIGGNKHFNFNGAPGGPPNPPVGLDGTDGSSGQVAADAVIGFLMGRSRVWWDTDMPSPCLGPPMEQGHNAAQVAAGHPGHPGGSFFAVALHTQDIANLKVTSIGGRGGSGQHGGRGGNGGRGADASGSYSHPGYSGGNGGNGADGGAGGRGGLHGSLRFIGGDGNAPDLIQTNGDAGEHGRGGEGGAGGPPGRGIRHESTSGFLGIFGGSDRTWVVDPTQPHGSRGANGVAGRSTLNLVQARPPIYTIVERQSFADYMIRCRIPMQENGADEEFDQFLANDQRLRAFFQA